MEIIFSSRAKKQLESLDLRFQEKIINSLKKFSEGRKVDIKKLKGKKDEFRIRVGNYRILLDKIPKGFFVTKVGARENIYLIFI